MPPALPSLFPFSPVLCSIWVPCRAAPGFAHSTEPCRASHGCSQLAAFMSELTNLLQGIKQKLGSPCSPCTPQRGCWTLPRGFLRAHGCMEQPSVILNHGSENPLWLSPSAVQRDDKPASSVIAFFCLFLPSAPPSPVGALRPPQHTLLPWHAAHAHCKEDSSAPLWHSTQNKSALSLSAASGAPHQTGSRDRICTEEQKKTCLLEPQ